MRNLLFSNEKQMANNSNRDNERLNFLIRFAKIGWWEADFRNETYTYSDFIAETLGIDYHSCPFSSFHKLIREDYRSRVLNELVSDKNSEGIIFPLETVNGTIWVETKHTIKEKSDGKLLAIEGSLQVIDNPEKSNSEEAIIHKLNNQLYQQSNISKSLISFLQKEDIREIVNESLSSLLAQFNGERGFIMEYDWENEEQSCLFEVTTHDRYKVIDKFQKIPLKTTQWWDKQICALKTIAISHIDEIPEGDKLQQYFIKDLGVKSTIIVPLVANSNKVWGYAGIDTIKHPRQWSKQDILWFSSVMNMINICLQLRNLKDVYEKDKQLLHDIYKSLPIGLEVFDKNGILIEANDKDVEILGMARKEEYMGVNIFNHPVLPLEVKERMKKGESMDFNSSYDFSRVHDGYYKSRPIKKGAMNLTTKIVPVIGKDNQIQNYLFINIDNTATTNAYLRIQEFEEYFSLIADFAKVGYFKWDLIKNEGFAISQWFKNLNKDANTLITKDIDSIYENLLPEDAEAIKEFYRKAATGEAQTLQREVQVMTEDENKPKWLRCTFTIKEYAPENDIIELIGLSIDITELKEMILAKDKAEALDKLKSAFLANISHEIRTPLNAIVGFSTLLIDIDDIEQREDYISIIQHNNELLLKLISDMLDLSKMEANMFELFNKNIDVKEMSRDVMVLMKEKETPQLRILFDESSPDISLYGDADRIKQIIFNFINNALKFTTKGYICYGYREVDNNMIQFYVEDTGIGIEPQDIPKAFERFVKLNSFVQGTGLGLPICKSLVEQMGGEIGVESQVGVGSRFWFTHPYKRKV